MTGASCRSFDWHLCACAATNVWADPLTDVVGPSAWVRLGLIPSQNQAHHQPPRLNAHHASMLNFLKKNNEGSMTMHVDAQHCANSQGQVNKG